MAFRNTFKYISMIFLLSGCTALPADEYWRITIAAPQHYPVWVTHLQMEKSGVRSWRQPIGSVDCCWRGPLGPRGKGAQVEPFPDLVFVSWFSLAEQKYYAKLIELPSDTLERMRKRVEIHTSEGITEDARHTLTLGLAPGGTLVGWILNQRGNEIEILRAKASEIEGESTDQFSARTEAYLKEHGQHLDKHGLQLDKW